LRGDPTRGIPVPLRAAPVCVDACARLPENITDPIAVLLHLFGGGQLACLESADADNDGRIDTTDAVLLLGYLFRSGAPPASPGPPGAAPCGPDPDAPGSPGDLGCGSYAGCGA
jgi:hypothetical protein